MSCFLFLPCLNSFHALSKFGILQICKNKLFKKISLSLSLDFSNVPLFRHIQKLYINVYKIGTTLSKRDKLGIHKYIEELVLQLFDHIIEASLASKENKINPLQSARMKTEKLKHLIRMEYTMNIINEKTYIRIERDLVEISKMTTGWLKNCLQK